jgi:hypothetical protein
MVSFWDMPLSTYFAFAWSYGIMHITPRLKGRTFNYKDINSGKTVCRPILAVDLIMDTVVRVLLAPLFWPVYAWADLAYMEVSMRGLDPNQYGLAADSGIVI